LIINNVSLYLGEVILFSMRASIYPKINIPWKIFNCPKTIERFCFDYYN